MTTGKGRKRRRGASAPPGGEPDGPSAPQSGTGRTQSAKAAPKPVTHTTSLPPAKPEAGKASGDDKQEPRLMTRVLKSTWTWVGTVTAGTVSAVLAVVIWPTSSPSTPSRISSSSAPPVTALIDLTGSGPCGSPQTVVPAPGPVGKSIYADYPGQSPSGGWLNVLVQGDGGAPVTIESITAKVISRQREKPGAVLYSDCQGYSPSHTYVRLDLRASQPAAVNVPEPNPTGPATVVPLPVEVTGDSPAQFYIQPVSGGTTVRWRLQIHWERGNDSGTLTATVSNSQEGAAGLPGGLITTVGTDGDAVLCPNGPGDTWSAGTRQTC